MKLERIAFFPFLRSANPAFKHTVVVGIGGNEGDVKKRFVALFRFLQNDRRFFVVETSPILQNPPFGYCEQNDFYNAVMVMQTSLHVRTVLKTLLHVEKLFGRKRSFKNAPRTLDLDIIFFDTLKRKQKHLTLPHPHWAERLSVIIPLVLLKRYKG